MKGSIGYWRSCGRSGEGLVFANLVDFDTLFGHRNDVEGYAGNLERFDERLGEALTALRDSDLLIITADHGNDPTTPSTDHSREYVPILLTGARVRPGADLGHATHLCRPRADACRQLWRRVRLPVAPASWRRSLSSIREALEQRERETLAPQAAKSAESRGRLDQRARRRCAAGVSARSGSHHSLKAFRRLKHKTQVFFAPEGDHYRTRLTHTLEVSQIARTIAKVLRLHEELTESIALGHDLGHTPFGHAGERVLDSLVPGGFRHYEQSLRIVDVLENDGRGLNLTWEVRDGIGRHSKGKEGSPVGRRPVQTRGDARRADHARRRPHRLREPRHRRCRAGGGDTGRATCPVMRSRCSGRTSSARIARMVKDVVTETQHGDLTEIRMSDAVLSATLRMRAFLFEAVYENEVATAEFKKATGILGGLWERVRERPSGLLDERIVSSEGLDVAARDFLAGMSDRFAVSLYERLFIPKPWVGPMAWNQL